MAATVACECGGGGTLLISRFIPLLIVISQRPFVLTFLYWRALMCQSQVSKRLHKQVGVEGALPALQLKALLFL